MDTASGEYEAIPPPLPPPNTVHYDVPHSPTTSLNDKGLLPFGASEISKSDLLNGLEYTYVINKPDTLDIDKKSSEKDAEVDPSITKPEKTENKVSFNVC